MELDKLLLQDSQKEIESLENETKRLLDSVRGRHLSQVNIVKGKSSKKKSCETAKKRSQVNISALNLRESAKTTIEILDDASPDVTPRFEANDQPIFVDSKSDTGGQLNFDKEKQRIGIKLDTFSPNIGFSVFDLEKEKARLGRIEDSIKAKRNNLIKEVRARSTYLAEDRAALKIQSVFRGHIGRKRAKIIRTLESILLEKDFESDWIEVVDKDTGDKWYFNKKTKKSQWNKPRVLNVSLSSATGTINVLEPSTSKLPQTKVPKTKLVAKQKSPSVLSEINKELGVTKLSKSLNLTAPDGSFKPHLRNVVLDALLDTRFDSVATVLADNRWYSKNEEITQVPAKQLLSAKEFSSDEKIDTNKFPMVSLMKFKKEHHNKKENTTPTAEDVTAGTQVLTVNNIEHNGFEQNEENESSLMCFGCWSAGLQHKCALHSFGAKTKPSETMLLCRNWDISVMRRRYRAEEIQEIFLRRETSLRYDPKRRRFYTVIEQKHPLYRVHFKLLEGFNNRMSLFLKIKYWLKSFGDRGKLHGKATEKSKLLRFQQIMYNKAKVDRFTTIHKEFLPSAPVTGYTWPERLKEEQYLFKVALTTINDDIDIILINPLPVPKVLYQSREYPIKSSKVFPLSKSLTRSQDTASSDILSANSIINMASPAAWLERLCSKISLDIIDSTTTQIKSFTPITGTQLSNRVKRPQPTTIKFISIGNKATTGNLAVGGLPWEQLVYHIISTYYSPQYGNFMVMDKSSVSPGVSSELTIVFKSIVMPPTVEFYVERPLEHPLTYRRSPTITLNSDVSPSNKFLYGINRSEQTGEQESHGFRTTTWAPKLSTFSEIDPQVFVPGQGIASLNVPKANSSFTTHADFTYPFCEPSTKDNSTLDFYHLLLTGVVSSAKAQIFTALTVQEPGQFQKAYRTDLPLGHLVVSVYRSWAFTQQDTIQEFKTDDGISYWYHRKTGQTFWERPLYEDEEPSALVGGTILDVEHPEEPMMLTKGAEGADRRYLQGEFRKQMLMHIETKKDALSRRKAAASTVKSAKQRGIIPSLPEFVSVSNNQGSSLEVGSKLDYSKSQNHSMVPNSEPSVDEQVLSRIQETDGGNQIMNMYPIKKTQSEHIVEGLNPTTEEPNFLVSENNAVMNNTVDFGIMNEMANSLGNIISRISNMENSTPQDILQLGLTMGLTLMQAGTMQNMISGHIEKDSSGNHQHGKIRQDIVENSLLGFPSVSEEFTEELKSPSRVSNSNMMAIRGGDEPIGKAYPTAIYSSDKLLDHTEEFEQRAELLKNKERPLNTMEIARNLSIEKEITPTPDALPPKVLTFEKHSNAEHELMNENIIPVVAYADISTQHPGGALPAYLRKQTAGLGTSFVSKEEKDSQMKVPANPHLTRNVLPLPVGFFEAIEAKHVAKQAVDYLPQVPNLPQSRTIGRVKPRSAAADWLMISFDPWSAGKNPLGTEFVPSLMAKADRLLGNVGGRSGEAIEALRQATVAGAFVHVQDEAGLAEQRAEITKAQVLAQDFKKLCSLCRHSKFSEAEQLINQPDWSVPIDYQDDQGNALVHVAAQNGSKRLVKLCLRRGASLNLQNLNGQTALHFAYGYGYSDVGDYLVSKGADDSIRNKDGLTCYEGLGARELALL